MLAASGYPTKKVLRAHIGKPFAYVETSAFGREYPASGNGTVTVVGPSADVRKWYAKVTVRDHIITKVE